MKNPLVVSLVSYGTDTDTDTDTDTSSAFATVPKANPITFYYPYVTTYLFFVSD